MSTALLPEQETAALRDRFLAVCDRLADAAGRSGRTATDVRLVAVSKTHPASVVATLARIWNDARPVFGENYLQEALDKQTAVASLLCADPDRALPEWHFTGHLQSRKARDAAGRFTLIHTLDSTKLAGQLQKAVVAGNIAAQDVLVQVNVSGEEQKSGVAPEDLERLLTDVIALPGIRVKGLMCLPPYDEDPEASRPYFVRLRDLRDRMRVAAGLDLPHLSMGMSHDCEVAVAEGATLVRIGTDIFGPRPKR